MKTRALATLSVLVLTAAFAPLAALPASGPAMTYDLSTRQTDPMRGGEYDGRLRLQISSDGIVSGTFLNTEGQSSDVVGGLKGTQIWLQIGPAGMVDHRYFTGTFVNGKLTGYAQARGLDTWTLEGKPNPH